MTIDEIVKGLDLKRHPEGGFFRETYRAAGVIPRSALPGTFSGDRPCSTAIYYLLPAGACSRLHRMRSDELWHLYAGGPLELGILHPGGREERLRLGMAFAAGERPQAVIPAGVWFGAWLPEGVSYVLAGCTVAPGFDFADFELADRRKLLAQYPSSRSLIEHLA